MPRTRGLMLDYIPKKLCNPSFLGRVSKQNDKPITKGDILYHVTRDFRIEDNWAIDFSSLLAKINYRNLTIFADLSVLKPLQLDIFDKFKKYYGENCKKIGANLVYTMPKNIGAIITDFNPLLPTKVFEYAHFEVDSHNICPTKYVSSKQEYTAATFRPKIYSNIALFLSKLPIKPFFNEKITKKLNDFIENRLNYYALDKNDYQKDATSHLSMYLNIGLISSHRIALEIIKSDASRENKEAFLEEIIVRKELADNFCLYNKNFKSLKGAPTWAKNTLIKHKNDIRNFNYTQEEFEQAKTHDTIWNQLQETLLNTGYIQGHARMYWAKKILEWSDTPEQALKTAIYLNDKYSLDGNSPNGYVGILWSIAGLHDRPFREREVTGSIRPMNKP